MNPMGAAASCWCQGNFESLIKRLAIPRDLALTLVLVIGPAGCHLHH